MNATREVLVCQHSNCCQHGSRAVLETFQTYGETGFTVRAVGCQGQCNMGPTVRILPDETWYCRVKVADVAEIVDRHLRQGQPVDRLLHPRMHPRFSV